MNDSKTLAKREFFFCLRIGKTKTTPVGWLNSLLAGPTGFEPAIFSVTGRRDRPASLRALVIVRQFCRVAYWPKLK